MTPVWPGEGRPGTRRWPVPGRGCGNPGPLEATMGLAA